MPAPFDDATTLLTTMSAMVRTVYHDTFQEMHSRFGGNTNKWFKPSSRVIEGDGVTVQMKDALQYGARLSKNMNADFPTPRSYRASTYVVRLTEDAATNDFRRLSTSLRCTHLDLNRISSKKIAPEDFVSNLIEGAMGDVGETTAMFRHLPKTGRIALINGTPAKNDNRLFSACSSISTTGGARFPVDNGSVASFQRNNYIDVYNGAVKRFTVFVTDYNPRDKSVGVYGLDASGNPSSSVDLTGIADNDALYKSDAYDTGIISIGAWFTEATSGESFFTRDRSTADYRFMQPHKSGPTTNALFTKNYIDDAMTELGYIQEDPDGGYAVVTTLELEQRYRQEVGEDVLLQFPTTEQKGKLIASYGYDGAIYRHPTIGRLALSADPFAIPNTVRMLRIGDWECQYPGSKTFEWLPGDTGGWYRMQSTTPGNGRTTVYQMDGMVGMADLCLNPRVQIEIGNVLHA